MSCWAVSDDTDRAVLTGRAATEAEREKAVVAAGNTPGISGIDDHPVLFEASQPMLKDPNKIYPGQVLRIPPLDS